MSTAILTIDDIASKNTPAIADYLVSHGIQAVMFAVGQNVEKFYDNAIYALQKGMIVGNHSYSHPAFSKLSYEQAVEEIEKNEAILDKLYRDAGVPRVYRPFRFPYGDKGRGAGEGHYEAIQKYLKAQGFSKLADTQISFPWYRENGLDQDVDTFWTFDFGEYMMHSDPNFTEQTVYQRIEDRHPQSGGALLEEGSSHIVLLHAHDLSDEMVPGYYAKFLDYCMDRGVEFTAPKFL